MASPLQQAVADIQITDYVSRVSIVDFVLIKLRVFSSRSHHGCLV